MAEGFKHLITCRCILPQFKRMDDPPQHKFVVFSIIDDSGTVQTRFAQCNNCGIIHKVTELCTSEIVGKDYMSSLPSIDDVRASVPSRLASVLDAARADIATWEMARFIIENKKWGSFIVLDSDKEDELKQVKYVSVLGEDLFKVDVELVEEVVK